MSPLDTTIDRNYILSRMNNWKTRLDNLFSDILTWAHDIPVVQIQVKETKFLQAREELMQQFNVDPIELRAIAIRSSRNKISFVPLALWVIGSNGRVNIKTNKHSYILVDMGGQVGMSSQWLIVNPAKRSQRISFEKAVLTNLLLEDKDLFS